MVDVTSVVVVCLATSERNSSSSTFEDVLTFSQSASPHSPLYSTSLKQHPSMTKGVVPAVSKSNNVVLRC